MREAENGDLLIDRIQKEVGLQIEIIDGLKEAEIIRSTSIIDSINTFPTSFFVDVGGGSTEVSVIKDNVFG